MSQILTPLAVVVGCAAVVRLDVAHVMATTTAVPGRIGVDNPPHVRARVSVTDAAGDVTTRSWHRMGDSADGDGTIEHISIKWTAESVVVNIDALNGEFFLGMLATDLNRDEACDVYTTCHRVFGSSSTYRVVPAPTQLRLAWPEVDPTTYVHPANDLTYLVDIGYRSGCYIFGAHPELYSNLKSCIVLVSDDDRTDGQLRPSL